VDEELISKKELLEQTGISYGQLYRWKRKNLIPEDWFIKKSAFTGQETFFPKERILKRIEKIKDLKEDSSLTELADVFSPVPGNMVISQEQINNSSIISKPTMDFVKSVFGISGDKLDFDKTLFAFAVDGPLSRSEINSDEAALALNTMEAAYKKLGGKPGILYVIRKFGVSTCVLAGRGSDMYFDPNVKIILRSDLEMLATDLKTKI